MGRRVPKLHVIHLSARLNAVAKMVTHGMNVCDLGCDHAYVSMYLVHEGISPRALAMDIKKRPLSIAKENIKEYGLLSSIETRLSDGLTQYKPGELGENTTLICAGMGGWLMRNILEKDPEKTCDFSELILSPQSDQPMFRRFLRESFYCIVDEDIVLEGGNFYPIIKAVKAEKNSTDKSSDEDINFEDILGPVLLRNRHPVLKIYLRKYIEQQKTILQKIRENAVNDASFQKEKILKKELEKLQDLYADWS